MTQLLQNAAYGTALILAAALLRQTLKNRLLPGARLLLWAVCLLRLLTPVPLEGALSLWGLSRLSGPQTQQSVPTPPVHIPDAPDPTVIPVHLPDTPGVSVYIPAADAPAVPAPPASGPFISWGAALLTVWLLVGLVLTIRYVLSWRRTRRAVNCAIPVGRGDPRYTPLPRCARLREGPMEGAPLTFGTIKPTVVLSPGLEGKTLECVLAHEGVHARRRDNLWHYVMALALVIHWWNPAVWLMARLLRRDIELSCDRAAVNKLGAERRADYANALLSLATQAKGPAFCHTFGRKAAEERITAIMKYKKATALGLVLSLLLVCGVTVAFATEPVEPKSESAVVEPAATEPVENVKPDLTEVEILNATLEQMLTDLKQKLGYTPIDLTAQSGCSHPNLMSGKSLTVTGSKEMSESEHLTGTKVYRTCPDCNEDVLISEDWASTPHNFGAGRYISSNHSAANPKLHFATYSHSCTVCNGGPYTYTSLLPCTTGGCIDPQSITPEPAEADPVPAGEDQPTYVDPDTVDISEYAPIDDYGELPTFDEDGDSSVPLDLRDAIVDQCKDHLQDKVADWLATQAG